MDLDINYKQNLLRTENVDTSKIEGNNNINYQVTPKQLYFLEFLSTRNMFVLKILTDTFYFFF